MSNSTTTALKGNTGSRGGGREALLAAAFSILSESGYGALTVSAICRRAKVSPPSLYHHFGDKAGLLKVLIEESIARDVAIVLEATHLDAPPVEQIDSFIEISRNLLKGSEANTNSVLMALNEARGESPDVAAAVDEARHGVFEFVAHKFGEVLEVSNGETFAHVYLSFALLLGQVAMSRADNREELFSSAIDSLRHVIVLTAAAARPDLLEDDSFRAQYEAETRSTKRAVG